MSGSPTAASAPARPLPWLAAGGLLALLPMLLGGLPPITDLPQQLAQIPLAGQASSGEATDLTVRWLTPNKLSYPLLAIAWWTLPPPAAARAATALVAAVWLLALAWLATRRKRPVSSTLLAFLLLFNHIFYLGLFNFVVGLAAFVFWFEALDRERRSPPAMGRTAGLCALGGLALYLSHALWLAAGLAWLAVVTLLDRRPLRWQLAAGIGLAPTLALVAFWYPSLAAAGWGSPSSYGPALPARLSFAGVTNTALGGLAGWLEPLTLAGLAAWIGLALWQHRGSWAQRVDRRLLAAAALLLLFALLLPDKIDRTLRVASRWMPVGVALLLLALPAPRVRTPLKRLSALTVVAAFCLTTALAWRSFHQRELAGLEPALAALPETPRLLGLDFVRDSPRFKGPVYMHLPAYGQLLRGGRLGFSFTSLASSLVTERELAAPDPWSPGLEWAPQLLRPSDLNHFDHLLVHAPPELAAALLDREPRLVPLTDEAPWRLFAVTGAGEPNRP